MKTLLSLVFAAVFALSTLAVAQDTMKPSPSAAKTAKAASVMGTISADGKAFVSDKDKKTWTISNPDAVKGHEGHHVVLKGHLKPDTNEVEVVSLKMAKATTKDEMQKY